MIAIILLTMTGSFGAGLCVSGLIVRQSWLIQAGLMIHVLCIMGVYVMSRSP